METIHSRPDLLAVADLIRPSEKVLDLGCGDGLLLLKVMEQDTRRMRGERPFVFTNLREGQGLADIVTFIEREGMLAESA